MFTLEAEVTYNNSRNFPKENSARREVFTIVTTPSERLRHFIKAKFKTQRALSLAAEVPESQISDYLTGRTEIGRAALMKLGAVGLNTHWLLFGTGEMTVPGYAFPNDPPTLPEVVKLPLPERASEDQVRERLLDDIADDIADRVAERLKIHAQSEWGAKMRRQLDDESREHEGADESGEPIED